MKADSPMKLTFLGTGTSMGVPVAGGFGHETPTGDYRDQRYRTSAWIQTKESSILIDVGPEFRLQSLRSGIKHIDLILITHEHNDHVAGLDDLRPFNYVQNQRLPVFTTETCKASIQKRFDYMFPPNKTPGSVDIDIDTSDEPFHFRDCHITPLPAMHGRLRVNGYRINDLAYITDTNFIPDSTFELIRGCKVLVLSALRPHDTHPTHYIVPEAVEVAQKTGIPEVYFVHMSSHVIHARDTVMLPENMKFAFDQQVVLIH